MWFWEKLPHRTKDSVSLDVYLSGECSNASMYQVQSINFLQHSWLSYMYYRYLYFALLYKCQHSRARETPFTFFGLSRDRERLRAEVHKPRAYLEFESALHCVVLQQMGLPPLEYIDCFLDSPNFREVTSKSLKTMLTMSSLLSESANKWYRLQRVCIVFTSH